MLTMLQFHVGDDCAPDSHEFVLTPLSLNALQGSYFLLSTHDRE
jgi:hypothetical protein